MSNPLAALEAKIRTAPLEDYDSLYEQWLTLKQAEITPVPLADALAPHIPAARRRCACGRPVAMPDGPVGGNGWQCAECDDPIPASAQAPSQPTTPGGVFDRRYP